MIQQVFRAFALFALAGLFEIGGGWLVWQWMREGRPWTWAALGAAVVALYGFVPPLQAFPHFGRVFAAYGAVFIGLSLAWGRLMDGFAPDGWDLAGAVIALLGSAIMLFGPRG